MRKAMLCLVFAVLAFAGIATLLGIAAGQMHEADYGVERWKP